MLLQIYNIVKKVFEFILYTNKCRKIFFNRTHRGEYDCPSFVAEKNKLMQLLARIFKGAKLFKLLRDTISSKVGIGTLLSSVGNILKCIIFQTDQIEDCWCGTNWLLTSQFNVEFCAFASEWKVPNNIFSRQPEYNFFNRAHQPFSFFFQNYKFIC